MNTSSKYELDHAIEEFFTQFNRNMWEVNMYIGRIAKGAYIAVQTPPEYQERNAPVIAGYFAKLAGTFAVARSAYLENPAVGIRFLAYLILVEFRQAIAMSTAHDDDTTVSIDILDNASVLDPVDVLRELFSEHELCHYVAKTIVMNPFWKIMTGLDVFQEEVKQLTHYEVK